LKTDIKLNSAVLKVVTRYEINYYIWCWLQIFSQKKTVRYYSMSEVQPKTVMMIYD